MSLADKARVKTVQQGRPSYLRDLRDSLNAKGKREFDEAMADRTLTHRALRDAIKDEYKLNLATSTIALWRREHGFRDSQG